MVRFDLFSLQKVLGFSDRESAIYCARCMKVCIGETLRFNDQLFHANCLVCLGMYEKYAHIFHLNFCRAFSCIACHINSFGTEICIIEIHVIFLSVARANSACENGILTVI